MEVLRKHMEKRGLAGPGMHEKSLVEGARVHLIEKLPAWESHLANAGRGHIVELGNSYFEYEDRIGNAKTPVKGEMREIVPKIFWGVKLGKVRAMRKQLEKTLEEKRGTIRVQEKVVEIGVPGGGEVLEINPPREIEINVPGQERKKQGMRMPRMPEPGEMPPPEMMPPMEYMHEEMKVMGLMMELMKYGGHGAPFETINIPPNPEIEKLLRKNHVPPERMQKAVLEQIKQLHEMGVESKKKQKEDFEKVLDNALKAVAGKEHLMESIADATEGTVEKNMDAMSKYPFPKGIKLEVSPELEERYPFLNQYFLAALTRSGLTPEIEAELETVKEKLIPEPGMPHKMLEKVNEIVENEVPFYVEPNEHKMDPEDAAVQSVVNDLAVMKKNEKAMRHYMDLEEKVRSLLGGK